MFLEHSKFDLLTLLSAASTENGLLYAVGDDRKLKEIQERSVSKVIDTGVVLTQLVISAPPHRMLFAGAQTGAVRAYPFPIVGECCAVGQFVEATVRSSFLQLRELTSCAIPRLSQECGTRPSTG